MTDDTLRALLADLRLADAELHGCDWGSEAHEAVAHRIEEIQREILAVASEREDLAVAS